MLIGLNKKELEIVLDKIIDQLAKAGFIPTVTPQKKNDMISDIASVLENDKDILLTKDKLIQPETMKALGAACMMQCKPQLKLDFRVLFKNKLELTLEEKKLFQELYKTMIDLKSENDPKKKAELINRLDKLIETLAHRLRSEDKKALLQDLHIQKLLADQRRADYGVDTQNPGSLLKVFQGVCMGNLSGKINLAMPGSENAAGQAKDDNMGTPDPIGTKASNAINNLLDGSINTPSELLVATAIQTDIPKSALLPQAPKLSPQ